MENRFTNKKAILHNLQLNEKCIWKIYNCLIVAVLSPTRELLTRMETWQLPVNGCKKLTKTLHSCALSSESSLVCHTSYCDTGQSPKTRYTPVAKGWPWMWTWVKICSPPPVMVLSPIELKILKWDEKLQTNAQTNFLKTWVCCSWDKKTNLLNARRLRHRRGEKIFVNAMRFRFFVLYFKKKKFPASSTQP